MTAAASILSIAVRRRWITRLVGTGRALNWLRSIRWRRRVRNLLAGVNIASGTVLEIGPLERPIVPRRANVFYSDVETTENLKRQFLGGVNRPDLIENIDYVVRNNFEYANIGRKFDFIVASHVIEHVPDFIGWLESLINLLNDNGILFLAVPDRRFTFDYDRPISTLGQALEAYFEKRQAATFGQVFDNNALINVCHGLAVAKTPGRKDVHCWVFTFDSFLSLINGAIQTGVLKASIYRAINVPYFENEFYISLKKAG